MEPRKLLLCVTRLRPEERAICEELRHLGFSVEIVLDSGPLAYINEDDNRPALALIRSMSQSNALTRATFLDLAGIRVLNSVKAILTCTNKLSQALLFKREKIDQPLFKAAFCSEDIVNAFARFKDTFVIKPLSSSWGRGIVRIVNEDCMEAWLAARDSVDLQEKHYPLLLQEYIDKGNYDVRVFIIGSRPVVAFKRISGNWKTNTHLGAKVEPVPVCERIREITGQVTRVLGEGIYGLDLLFDRRQEKYLVCEINQNPEFANSSKIHKVDLARLIAEYVDSLVPAAERKACVA